MNSIAHTSTLPQVDPLRFLADVSCDYHERVRSPHLMSPSSELSAGSSSPSSSVRSVSSAPTSTDMNDVASPHNSYTKSPDYIRETRHRTLRNATARHSSSASASVPFISQNKASRRTRKITNSHLQGKMQMKKKRQELLDKASKIKSLDNSPVNERQLLVLRMVYDEITMYPCESWMVLLAIVINRFASSLLASHAVAHSYPSAYKQVKNWFSNERQKGKAGDSISIETSDGDKVRIRTTAFALCQEWSDSFLEEVVMIHNYRIQRNSRFRALLQGPEDPSAARPS